ncbi:MAG: CBS domain-containing protein [Alphaproteobacteria bacterium]|jgi:CBS domain-containing protein|nr:CBS domain-containing protein [Alphaproteobacteria bacterium]
MNVATVLQHKGGNVVTARPDSSIAEICNLLRSARIGAVIISPDRVRVEGIVSERDIVRALAEHGAAALSKTAADLMTRGVITCAPDEDVAGLMTVMTTGRFRHVPVCDEGVLVGIVSIGDVVRVRVEEIEHEAEALRTYVTQG